MELADYKRTSHDVWEAMAPGWNERHAYFEKTSRPVTVRMLERLGAAQGQTILELAGGSGLVGLSAASLVGRSGRVVISDFSEAMVKAAEQRAAELGIENVECRMLDAERLDVPDASFDAVLCRWGYMLMGNPAAAVRETRRALRAGGRVVCAVFAGPEQNQWAALPAEVLRKRGHMPDTGPSAPGILALASHERLRDLFSQARFGEPTIEEVSFSFDFAGADDYWGFMTEAAGAIAAVLNRLDSVEREQIREELTEGLAPFGRSGRIVIPATSLVVSAS
jgi:ubiquinone/menaquinone biosynthesis C-methylase UbiE